MKGNVDDDRAEVLLVSDFDWNMDGGGAQIVKSLVSRQVGRELAWATLSAAKPSKEHKTFSIASASANSHKIRSYLCDAFLYRTRIAREVICLGERLKVKKFWFILHGATVQIARDVSAVTATPIHVTVHDDPAYGVAMRSTRYVCFTPMIESDFKTVLRRANSVDVVSHGMLARYQSRYGVQSTVVHRGLEIGAVQGKARDPDTRLSVGLLGNIYSYAQIAKLAEALMHAKKSLLQKPKMLLIGGSWQFKKLKLAYSDELEIDFQGHLPESEAVRKLMCCTCLYVNYPFGWRSSIFRSTSFPTKLSTYIQACRPIICHAPSDSTLNDLPGNSLFYHWQSLDIEEGSSLLVSLMEKKFEQDVLSDAAVHTLTEYYDQNTNRRRLSDCLGIEL